MKEKRKNMWQIIVEDLTCVDMGSNTCDAGCGVVCVGLMSREALLELPFLGKMADG